MMRRLPLLLATVVLTVLPAAACGGTDRSPDTEETAVDPRTSSSPSSPSSSPSGDVGRAVDDLASALGVAAGDVEVVAVEEVTWRDGSRGCAKPGEMYTQALVDGQRITLRADGRTYEYHSGGSQPPTRCDKPTE
ncbi:hypothetical protein GCM10027078_03410 [Nocardioides flavus (ex Wang et al. 2016)]